jgi:hypothetical protein
LLFKAVETRRVTGVAFPETLHTIFNSELSSARLPTYIMTTSPPPFDFYTYIHKSLRRQIFDVVAAAAALDFTSTSSS